VSNVGGLENVSRSIFSILPLEVIVRRIWSKFVQLPIIGTLNDVNGMNQKRRAHTKAKMSEQQLKVIRIYIYTFLEGERGEIRCREVQRERM
jgi:hypothetical protein